MSLSPKTEKPSRWGLAAVERTRNSCVPIKQIALGMPPFRVLSTAAMTEMNPSDWVSPFWAQQQQYRHQRSTFNSYKSMTGDCVSRGERLTMRQTIKQTLLNGSYHRTSLSTLVSMVLPSHVLPNALPRASQQLNRSLSKAIF